jgi:hypothetical protein
MPHVWISIPHNNNNNPWKVSYQAYAFLGGTILRASLDIVVVLDLRCLLRQWKVCRCLSLVCQYGERDAVRSGALYHRGRHHQSKTIAVFVYLLLWFFFPSCYRHWQKNRGIWRRPTQFDMLLFHSVRMGSLRSKPPSSPPLPYTFNLVREDCCASQ